MAAQTSTSTGTPAQNAQANTQARPAQGQLVSPAVAAATSGLADSLEASAKSRIEYGA